LRRQRADHLAVTQDRDAVGDAQHFLDAMGDVDNPDSLGLESANLREEEIHLAGGQRSGRLIESQDPAPTRQARGDLHHLPAPDPSVRTGVEGSTSASPTFSIASRAA